MKNREVIDEPHEAPCKLVLATKGTYIHKYALVRGNGILAFITAPEHVAQQICELVNAGQLYYNEENLPSSVKSSLQPVMLNYNETVLGSSK